MRKILLIALLLAALGGGYVGFQLLTSFRTTGDAAIRAMNQQEITFLFQRLERIPAGASRAQVERILGTPYRLEPTERPSWRGPQGDSTSRVDVYFANGRAFQIRWIKVGSFMWEKQLRR